MHNYPSAQPAHDLNLSDSLGALKTCLRFLGVRGRIGGLRVHGYPGMQIAEKLQLNVADSSGRLQKRSSSLGSQAFPTPSQTRRARAHPRQRATPRQWQHDLGLRLGFRLQKLPEALSGSVLRPSDDPCEAVARRSFRRWARRAWRRGLASIRHFKTAAYSAAS